MGSLEDDVRARLSQLEVLIVDDEYRARKLMRTQLRALGCERVQEAGDGDSGLVQIRQRRPDLVLLDWSTRGVKGSEVVRTLRASGTSGPAGVAVIMLARSGDAAAVLEAIRLGVHDFLIKPVSSAALEARMLAVLGRMRAGPAHALTRPAA